MNELFQVDIENLNLTQLSRWIKQCRTAIQPSDRPIYTEYPYRYQEAVAEFCKEYIEFFNAHKGTMTSAQFDRALKLSVLKFPRYVAITSDGEEIDITADVEQLQLENTTSHLISKSINREADRVKQYSKNIASFKSGKREALHAIINQLSLETITYKVNILEKAEQINKMDIKKVLREIKRGKWQTVERKLKPAESRTISDYLIADIRENHINKNVFYSFSKNKEEDKRRVYGKLFLCNVGFYIGLNAEEMEAVLRNEGYTIQCSNRPDDRILFDCFYYSFSRNYASALLKKDGWDGLEIGK
ncbi:MAG: hypothetical protein IJX53_04310 [Clostridia bacterium]|nr:hypothetical protein [Clostridia bacterium]